MGRLSRLVAPFALLAGLGPWLGHASAAETQSPPRARVEITVTDAEGTAVRLAGHQLAWDQTARLHESAGDHQHAIDIAMHPSADGKRVAVELSYQRDGATLVSAHDVDATLTEPVRLASADGTAQVVFVVRTEPARKPIEVDGSDDPLGGL